MKHSFTLKKDFGIYTMKYTYKKTLYIRFIIENDEIKILEGWYISGKTKRNITETDDIWKIYPGIKEQVITKAKRVQNNAEYCEIARDLGYPMSVISQLEKAETEFQADMIMRTAREAI